MAHACREVDFVLPGRWFGSARHRFPAKHVSYLGDQASAPDRSARTEVWGRTLAESEWIKRSHHSQATLRGRAGVEVISTHAAAINFPVPFASQLYLYPLMLVICVAR